MCPLYKKIVLSDDALRSKIRLIRDKNIVLKSDLAELLHLHPKEVKTLVNKNMHCFSAECFIQLTRKERLLLRWHINRSDQVKVTSQTTTKVAALAFTAIGVTKLASLCQGELHSPIRRLITFMQRDVITSQELHHQIRQLKIDFQLKEQQLQKISNCIAACYPEKNNGKKG